MKVFILSLGILLSSPICGLAQTKVDKDQASVYGTKAVQLINRATNYDEAISLLEKAKHLDPSNLEYPFNEARIFYQQQKYQEAYELLEKHVGHKDVTPLYFQLLGSTYKALRSYDLAVQSFKKGLDHFPKSAMLYHEIGVVEYSRRQFNKAMSNWEKGLKANPNYASNYYSLGKLLSYSDETIWAVLYGEMFMNLEPSTERSNEMSKILFKTYKKSIHLNTDTINVQFTRKSVKKKLGVSHKKASFSYDYAMAMVKSISSEYSHTELSLSSLNSIRHKFISDWYKDKRNKAYPNPLFDFQKQLINKGYCNAYNYWMFMHGDKEEFNTWVKSNKEEFNAFKDWFKDHRVKTNKKHYFSRRHY